MRKFCQCFISEESGQGMVEYGLILALIALIVIGVLTALKAELAKSFEHTSSEIAKATSSK